MQGLHRPVWCSVAQAKTAGGASHRELETLQVCGCRLAWGRFAMCGTQALIDTVGMNLICICKDLCFGVSRKGCDALPTVLQHILAWAGKASQAGWVVCIARCCGETKPASQFCRSSVRAEGLFCDCKACTQEARKSRTARGRASRQVWQRCQVASLLVSTTLQPHCTSLCLHGCLQGWGPANCGHQCPRKGDKHMPATGCMRHAITHKLSCLSSSVITMFGMHAAFTAHRAAATRQAN